MSDERLTTSSFQSLSVIHIIKSKSCLEEICPCQSYGSSRPLRSGCSSSTSGLSSFSRRAGGRLRGSGARRNEGGRDVVLTDADFPSNERPCGRSSACANSCLRLKRKRRNRRPIRHVWLNDANSVAPVVHSHARGAILSRCRDRLLNLRQARSHHQLQRPTPAQLSTRKCIGLDRHQARRSRGHVSLEQLSASRAILRYFRNGSRLSHDQSEAVRGADCIHRQPRRRCGCVLRSGFRRSRTLINAAMPDR